jgi:hypothetical protein
MIRKYFFHKWISQVLVRLTRKQIPLAMEATYRKNPVD